MKKPFIALALAILFGQVLTAVQAQPVVIEARRYVNDQGVEVLMSRNAPAPLEAAAPPASAPRAQKPMAAGAVPPPGVNTSRPSAAGIRDDHRVSVSQQAARDEEVERMLTLELLSEVSKLESRRKALRTSAAGADPAQHDDMATDVQRHEENIRALQRELARVRQNGRTAKAGGGSSEPSAVSWKP